MAHKSNITACVHFQPLELYPPVQNLIQYWSSHFTDPLHVYSLEGESSLGSENIQNAPSIKIWRHERLRQKSGFFRRNYGFLLFYWTTFYHLWRSKPSYILYFESLSFLPVWLYLVFSKVFRRRVKIFAHYHEYQTKAQYQKASFFERIAHWLEKRNYTKLHGVSHTNADRLSLFSKDNPKIPASMLHIWPNYPPIKWREVVEKQKKVEGSKVRLVYVGALGLETMYLKELVAVIKAQHGQIELDVYSQQPSQQVLDFFGNEKCESIQFKGAIPYEVLPTILPNYDIGLILYKGHIPNYVYNAPNKLFEYLSCGLHVLFPAVMKGSLPYEGAYRIGKNRFFCKSVDFSDTDLLAKAIYNMVNELKSCEYFQEKEYDYWAESSIKGIIEVILR